MGPTYYEMLAIEGVAIATSLLALSKYGRSIKLLSRVERVLGKLGRRHGTSGALVAFVAFALAASMSLLGRMPQPEVHDEFSNLLAADTFAHGRLTNPTHPMWVHFESFHIIQRPSYASKYPPGQGLTLALGQVLTGYPIVGAWLSTAAACAAVYWMLLAWAPAWLALVGGLMTALHPAILYWSQAYWGGQVAMIGGVLVFGAFRRILRKPRRRDALLLGLGLAILANSRPYEGMVASLPVGIALFLWMRGKHGPQLTVSLRCVVLPVVAVLAVTAAAMGYYNWRVTGSPLLLPYVVYERTYDVARPFIWQSPRPEPVYHHNVIKEFHTGWEMVWYNASRSPDTFVSTAIEKLRRLWVFFQGFSPLRLSLTFPLLVLPWYIRKPRLAFLLSAIALFTVSLLMTSWAGARLSAPIIGALIIVYIYGVRQLRLLKFRSLPAGRMLVWTTIILAIFIFTLDIVEKVTDKTLYWHFIRAQVVRQLRADGSRHLVIVRYGKEHWPVSEWVYNGADIDASKIVWAREMNPSDDRELIDYFKDRKIWLLDVYDDLQVPRLTPYPR